MAKRLRAGELRHTVTIQAPSTALDTFGQVDRTSWTDEKTIRAKIEPLTGEEAVLARQVYPRATQRVVIEYLSTMDTTGATQRRLSFGSRVLHIGAVISPMEEDWHLEMLCSEDRI